jgi:hypothetical protein
LLILVALLIAAVAGFRLRISTTFGDDTPVWLDAYLYFTAIAIGAVIQDIYSNANFLKALRGEALKAYRRIADIGASVDRLVQEVGRMQNTQSPGDPLNEGLRLIGSMINELRASIQSAVDDWADLLSRDEVRRLDDAREVKAKLATVFQAPSPPTEQDQTIAGLRSELQAIRLELPPALQGLARPPDITMRPRPGQYDGRVRQHYLPSIASDGALVLTVFSRLPGPLGPHAPRELHEGAPFRVQFDAAMFQYHLLLLNKDGIILGDIVNEVPGVEDNDFAMTLPSILPRPDRPPDDGIGGPYGTEIPGSSLDGISENDPEFYVRVPITMGRER